jgi:hypothetical protein
MFTSAQRFAYSSQMKGMAAKLQRFPGLIAPQ